jgi:hypothetical protein
VYFFGEIAVYRSQIHRSRLGGERRPPPAGRAAPLVWGNRGTGDRQLLKQLVHRLRQKIEADAGAPRYLVTASGIGYALRPNGSE